MSNIIRLSEIAKKEYDYWKKQDQKTFKRINRLFISIKDTPFEGIGKPEPLKHELAGYWSRRIDEKNRIIYTIGKERRNKYNKNNSNWWTL